MERLMAAAERDDRRRNGRRGTPSNPPEDPYGGYVLGWKVDSSTTTERRRNRMHHPDGRSVHTSEFLGRHRDRSSRDRSSREHSPREELNQSAPTSKSTPSFIHRRRPNIFELAYNLT